MTQHYGALTWKVTFRNCIHAITGASKMFFGYSRSYSMSQVLLELNLCRFDTLLFNSTFRFLHRWKNCNNEIVKYLSTLLNWLILVFTLCFIVMYTRHFLSFYGLMCIFNCFLSCLCVSVMLVGLAPEINVILMI